MSNQITTTESKKLQNLIDAVKSKFEIKDIVFYFLESMKTWKEKSGFITALIDNEEMNQDIKEKIQSEMQIDGFIVLKIENMDKMSKLTNFLTTDIFPYYNEQQKEMFA